MARRTGSLLFQRPIRNESKLPYNNLPRRFNSKFFTGPPFRSKVILAQVHQGDKRRVPGSKNLSSNCSFEDFSSQTGNGFERNSRFMFRRDSDSEEVEKRSAIAFGFGWRKKGRVPICVGEQGKKFVIPILYLSHPLFTNLLQKAREEYGFHQTGVLAIPCYVHEFQQILWQITFTHSSSQ
ncbi:hypothetical protein SUGI_1111290 [Cryptomeria japonica]|nr:hypothetical protein SUGI_1111290 [Cryptomeria japonica]